MTCNNRLSIATTKKRVIHILATNFNVMSSNINPGKTNKTNNHQSISNVCSRTTFFIFAFTTALCCFICASVLKTQGRSPILGNFKKEHDLQLRHGLRPIDATAEDSRTSTGQPREHINLCPVPKNAHIIHTKTIPPFKMYVESQETKQNFFFFEQLKSGQWEMDVVRVLSARLAKGRHFVDIGANEGYFSLLAASLGARVTAFEPVARNVELLLASACLNEFHDNIVVYDVALSNESGKDCTMYGIFMFCDPDQIITGDKLKMPKRTVHVKRLDDFIFTYVDVLKADIEGFEEGAMRGGDLVWNNLDTGGPPGYVEFECNAKQAAELGFNTQYWYNFAVQHNCWFDFSLESEWMGLSFDSVFRLPIWFTGVPFFEQLVLSKCNGSNQAMICDPVQVFGHQLEFVSFVVVLVGLVALCCCGGGKSGNGEKGSQKSK